MLTIEQKERYARQILLTEIGEAGQERLECCRVLVAGVGGLGSLVSLYLAAAGVGTLRLADRDRVSLSDLNRQLIYREADVGRVKIAAAEERLTALNASCRIEPVFTDICAEADALTRDCDLVIDATDNLPARRAVNAAAVRRRIPMVHGGINGFSGTMTVISPGRGACLECLFPDMGSDPSPRPIPAVGPVVGVVASLQSVEALKLVLGIGKPAFDRILKINALTGEWKSIHTRQNPGCAICAEMPLD
jgi:molybdopterin-synthase adenylyltransferase